MWLSEFSKTNDAKEYAYAEEVYLKAYRDRQVWIDQYPRYAATFSLVGLSQNTKMMIGCLTKKRNDLQLWLNYADQATGCVVALDAHWLNCYAGVAMRKVNYSPTYLRRFVNIGWSMLQSQYEAAPDETAELVDLSQSFVLDLYAFKHPSFRSEHEVRISRLTAYGKPGEEGL